MAAFNLPDEREAAMARRLIQARLVAVAVLDKNHDLRDEIAARARIVTSRDNHSEILTDAAN